MNAERRKVFIAGGTGYIGQRLILRLLERGHAVRGLVRPGSERKLPEGCTAVIGNALDGPSYAPNISLLTRSSNWWGLRTGLRTRAPRKPRNFGRLIFRRV